MARTKVYLPRGGRSLNVDAGGRVTVAAGGVNSVGQLSPVNAVASTLTTALAGANNDMVFTAKTKGATGDNITIEYVDPAGANKALSVTVTGKAIAVSLATDGANAITSTAAQVKTAIDAKAEAAALVSVANAGADTGAGVVTALAATPLASGVDGTIGKAGDMHADNTYLYVASDDNTVADTNWRRIALGAAY